jgi:maltose O-acetyltransferase
MIHQLLLSLRRRINTYHWKSRLLSCGNCTVFDLNVEIYNPDFVSLGANCSVNEGVIIQSCEEAKVDIGSNVTLSYRCMILTGGLELKNTTTFKAHKTSGVIINDDVWIGAGCIILPGVSLAKGCVIAAGSVVTKDVDKNAIVAGNPARFLKFKNQ